MDSGESVGVSTEFARQRCEALGNVCLWCDEFFTKHYDLRAQARREPDA